MLGPMTLLTPGGSPQGLSFWSAAGICSRKWHYQNERRLSGELPTFSSPGLEGKPNNGFVGSLFHAYGQHGMEQKRTFTFDGETPIQGYQQEEDEAWRLVKAYKKFYPDWSTPAQSEVDISLTLHDDFTITGRVDALVWIEGLLDGCDHYFQPGLYVWDYKTASSRQSSFVDDYRLQVEGYALIWNLTHGPEDQVLGGVLDRITKTKEPQCDRFFVALPTQRRENHIIETWKGFYLSSKKNSRNLSACVLGYGGCSFKKRCAAED